MILTLLACFQLSSWQEVVASVLGVLSIWYARKANILMFPTGIVSVGLYVYLCFVAKIYADMSINAYYGLMSVYGWIYWAKKTDQLPISYTNAKGRLLVLISIPLICALLYLLLSRWTDSDVPLWDATTSSISMVAMVLMARKKIEHWLLWLVADGLSIPLYLHKNLCLTALQFAIFLLLAVQGWRRWRQQAQVPVSSL